MRFVPLFLLLVCGCVSPRVAEKPQFESSYAIVDHSSAEDTGIAALLEPYAARVRDLDNPIGSAAEDLRKGQPEGKLGNFVADLLLSQAPSIFSGKADVAVLNNGGLRVPIAQGPISQTTIFELMPFDNKVVAVDLTGAELLAVATRIARTGGQPIAGMQLEITSQGELIRAWVNGSSIDPKATYSVITTDYLAQGNNGFFEESAFARARPSPILLRDAIIEHIRQRTAPVAAAVDGRIKIVKPAS